MKTISEILSTRKAGDSPAVKPPPHELSATTELIREAGLFTPKYGRAYWLGKVKRAGVSYTEMHGILKSITQMEAKYNKGGRLTNLLTERAKALKTHEKDKSTKVSAK